MTGEADEYLKRAELVVREAAKRLDARKGECHDCKWYRTGTIKARCVNPVVQTAAQTVDQGYDRDRLAQCDTQRSTSSIWGPVVCGPDGVLFEQSEGFFHFLARIFR